MSAPDDAVYTERLSTHVSRETERFKPIDKNKDSAGVV
jgi:hypothetical protein